MNRKIVISGATGLIGKKIAQKLIMRGDEITIFSRSIEKAKQVIPDAYEYVLFDFTTDDWACNIEGKDGIIHLAGENVMAKRWNEKHKKNTENLMPF